MSGRYEKLTDRGKSMIGCPLRGGCRDGYRGVCGVVSDAWEVRTPKPAGLGEGGAISLVVEIEFAVFPFTPTIYHSWMLLPSKRVYPELVSESPCRLIQQSCSLCSPLTPALRSL